MKDIIFDPKIFINPPYKKCPQCGKESFGVLSIFSTHYTRRCRECFYPKGTEKSELFYLPELDKKVIYIDQFAISNMMKVLNPKTKAYAKGNVDNFWLELFEKLYHLYRMQLLICPYSEFHSDESLVSPFYNALKRMYELLSHGIEFDGKENIEIIQLRNYAKNWLSGEEEVEPEININSIIHGELNGWNDRFIVSVESNFKENWLEFLRQSRDQIHDGFKNLFLQWKTIEKFDFNDFFKRECLGYGTSIINTYFAYIQKQKAFKEDTQPTLDMFFPPQAVLTFRAIELFFNDEGVSRDKSFEKTIEFFKSPNLKNIPFIKIYALLVTAVARKAVAGQNRPPNKGMANDISAISYVLPYCDAIFIDKECAGLLQERPLMDLINFNTRIFSLNDKEDFLEYLESLEKNIPKNQLFFLNEVYGDSWQKPYLTIFKS